MARPDALTVVDVSVVHLAAATCGNAAARAEGRAAAVSDQAKRVLGYEFVPLSTETFGRLGKPAMALLNDLAECALRRRVALLFRTLFLSMLCVNSLSGCVVYNCVPYKPSRYALARVSSNDFRAGDDIPASKKYEGHCISP